MASNTKQVVTDLSPLLKVYADGTVERLAAFPHVPPSPDDPNAAVSSKDVKITPSLSARIHLPKPSTATEKLPILIHFHGGGFVMGSAFVSIDHHYMTLLARESRAIIISVEYRLAPEHPLPAAYEDSWTAINWVCSHALDEQTQIEKEPWIVTHGDLGRILVGGDSAGANITHHLAIRVGSDPLPGNLKIRGIILSHPGFWGSNLAGAKPREDVGENFFDKCWLVAHPSAPGGLDDPLINPVVDGAPNLSVVGCEKVLVCVSEKDPLMPWAKAYVEKLKRDGWKGEVEVMEIDGENHCFHLYNPECVKAGNMIKRMASFISRC